MGREWFKESFVVASRGCDFKEMILDLGGFEIFEY